MTRFLISVLMATILVLTRFGVTNVDATDGLMADPSVEVSFGLASGLLSTDDAETILTLMERLELDWLESQSVDHYYGQPTVPPGDHMQLLVRQEGENDVVLGLASELSDSERIIHRLNQVTEDLEVLVLVTPDAFEAYDEIYNIVEKRLYTQMIYAWLVDAPAIKVLRDSTAIDLLAKDREVLSEKLFILLGENVELTSDHAPKGEIEWRIPEAPVGLTRMLSPDTYWLQFAHVDTATTYGLMLLPGTVTEPTSLIFTDMIRGITLVHDIGDEKQATFDELIVFLSELFEH